MRAGSTISLPYIHSDPFQNSKASFSVTAFLSVGLYLELQPAPQCDHHDQNLSFPNPHYEAFPSTLGV